MISNTQLANCFATRENLLEDVKLEFDTLQEAIEYLESALARMKWGTHLTGETDATFHAYCRNLSVLKKIEEME